MRPATACAASPASWRHWTSTPASLLPGRWRSRRCSRRTAGRQDEAALLVLPPSRAATDAIHRSSAASQPAHTAGRLPPPSLATAPSASCRGLPAGASQATLQHDLSLASALGCIWELNQRFGVGSTAHYCTSASAWFTERRRAGDDEDCARPVAGYSRATVARLPAKSRGTRQPMLRGHPCTFCRRFGALLEWLVFRPRGAHFDAATRACGASASAAKSPWCCAVLWARTGAAAAVRFALARAFLSSAAEGLMRCIAPCQPARPGSAGQRPVRHDCCTGRPFRRSPGTLRVPPNSWDSKPPCTPLPRRSSSPGFPLCRGCCSPCPADQCAPMRGQLASAPPPVCDRFSFARAPIPAQDELRRCLKASLQALSRICAGLSRPMNSWAASASWSRSRHPFAASSAMKSPAAACSR